MKHFPIFAGVFLALVIFVITTYVGGQEPAKETEAKNINQYMDKLSEQYALAIARAVNETKAGELFENIQKDWLTVLHKHIIEKYYTEIVRVAGNDLLPDPGPEYDSFVRRLHGYDFIYKAIIKDNYKALKPFMLSLLAKTEDGPTKTKILGTIFQNRVDGDIKLFVKYLGDKKPCRKMTPLHEYKPFRICDFMFRCVVEIYGITKDDLGITEEQSLLGENPSYTEEKVRDSNIAKLKQYLKKKGLPKEEGKEEHEEKQDK